MTLLAYIFLYLSEFGTDYSLLFLICWWFTAYILSQIQGKKVHVFCWCYNSMGLVWAYSLQLTFILKFLSY